ncbi:MAG: M14 family zinc carboxypeptidase [Longimicrobiales bacterium]
MRGFLRGRLILQPHPGMAPGIQRSPRPSPSNPLLLLPLLLRTVVAVSLAAGPLSAQEERPDFGRPPASDTALAGSAVSQTFDWWVGRGIPAATPWGQAIDTAATRAILSWTTEPEYTTPLVDHVPEGGEVVAPSEHFGAPIGRPGVLHRVDEIYGYFEALDASSERVRFERLGETEEGNRLALVQVGGEANLARLDAVKRGMAALADPRATTDAEADRLIADLPVIYTFYAGLHSTETGPPEMVMELAYRLAVSEDPLIREIRDEVVVFIIPVVEPDGRNRVVDWHRRHNPAPVAPDDEPPGPPYWGKYIFHDNNRDGLQMSARLTQILIDLALEWHYPIGHDLHESVPYLYTSTGTGPYNPTIDPITVGEWQWLANYEVTALTAYGLPGVWTHGFYDGWYPGYLMWVTNNDLNAMGRFYETFGNGVPWTQARELEGSATDVEWYRPSPPRDSTIWSLRNNTNYMQSGALTALSLVAQNRERVLRQFWTKSKNSLAKGRTEAPYAWVVPADQPRRGDAAYMLDLMRRHGIELHRAADDGTFGDVAIEDGDVVIRMDQPYRNFILTLMRRQEFPEDAPTPYDDVAWTFPLMFNVSAHAVEDSAVLAHAMEPVGGAAVRFPGVVRTRRGAQWWVVLPHASARSIAAYDALASLPLEAAQDSFEVDDRSIPPGAWLVSLAAAPEPVMEALARDFGLEILQATDGEIRGVARHAMDRPRLALLHTWRYTQDDGWVRYTFDQLGLAYDYIAATELHRMDLRAAYDVIVFPTQGARTSGKAIFAGVDEKWSPLAYTRTPEFPTHGFPDATEDMTGGMGYLGLQALTDFVERGGTLITLGSATTLPLELGMVRDVDTESPDGLFVPGSIVRGVVEKPASPLTYGYDPEFPLYHRFGPYLDVDDDLEEHVVMHYAETDSLVLSGLARNPDGMAGDPAIVVAPRGRGSIVLFGFDPLHRFQSHGDFALVWNALMHWNDLRLGIGEDEESVAAGAGTN